MKSQVIIGIVILVSVGCAGALIVQSFATAGPSYVDVSELRAMAAELRGPKDSVRVTLRGKVVARSIEMTAKGVSFRLRDDSGATQSIFFPHTAPPGLEGGREVHVKGRLFKDMILEADEINAKCPSKYEDESG